MIGALWQWETRMVDKLGNWHRLLVRLAAEFFIVVLGVSIALWTPTGLAHISDASEVDLGFMSDMEFQNLLVFKLNMIEQVDAAFQKTEIALMAVQQTIASQLATQRR